MGTYRRRAKPAVSYDMSSLDGKESCATYDKVGAYDSYNLVAIDGRAPVAAIS